MSTIISVPESLQFYFNSVQNASAVDQIIESESIPIALSWQEVEQYNRAKVSAKVIQLDYWLFIKEIWDRTWGAALKNTTYKEVDADDYNDDYSMDYVWSKVFYRTFELNNNKATFYNLASNSDNFYLQLGFNVESKDGTYDISNNLDLTENWNPPKDDDRSTVIDLIKLVGKPEIDITPLIDLSREAVSELRKTIS